MNIHHYVIFNYHFEYLGTYFIPPLDQLLLRALLQVYSLRVGGAEARMIVR